MNRRGFLRGMLALGVAPAIVQASSIMRIKPLILPGEPDFILASPEAFTTFNEEMTAIMRRAFVPRMVVQIYEQTPLLSGLIAKAQHGGEVGFDLVWDR